ncbi:MAG: hypothetical protein PHV53_00025 [Fermentimonas sp.]|nr:hypothetical protein [Fermentimonas sp.]
MKPLVRSLNSDESIELKFDLEDKVNTVRWITYNPDVSDSATFFEGSSLTMDNVPETARFIPAEI